MARPRRTGLRFSRAFRPDHGSNSLRAYAPKAIADGAPVVYEASFLEDGVFVAVDILERRRGGFVLVEVKSTLDVKEEHLPDVAIQVHVARRAGLPIRRAEVMHLNRECRHPDLSNLFVRENVTALIRPALRAAPQRTSSLLSALAGEIPAVETGPHCTTPHECPFLERCWPLRPEHHVSTLYRIRATKAAQLVADGYETLLYLPRKYATSPTARRQLRSVRSGKVIVERGLRRALARLTPPLAFLDFETINPAIPVWNGHRPYQQVPVQFSCHTLTPAGLQHHAWLADGPDDPREPFARALLAACSGARTVLAYNAPFEKMCVDGLIEALPHLADDLAAVSARIRDLLPIVRDHVYHPAFRGSFSMKEVLPAMVPELRYENLAIQDGGAASAALEGFLLDHGSLTADQRRALRHDLLEYCKLDTLGMVRMLDRLRELAEGR